MEVRVAGEGRFVKALAQYNVIFPDLAGIELNGADEWRHG